MHICIIDFQENSIDAAESIIQNVNYCNAYLQTKIKIWILSTSKAISLYARTKSIAELTYFVAISIVHIELFHNIRWNQNITGWSAWQLQVEDLFKKLEFIQSANYDNGESLSTNHSIFIYLVSSSRQPVIGKL